MWCSQGSVLGPLFFIIFINDLPNCCPLGNFRIFADDTNVFIHGDNIEELIIACRKIMIALSSWFISNKLTLNAEKTSFTIYKSPRKIINNMPDSISFLNHKINRVSSIKFLGVILDENLSFDKHINEVCNKLKRLFHVFYSIRGFLSKENIRTIYYALVYSRIKYGIAVYGQAKLTKIRKIQILQNQLIKFLAGKNIDTLQMNYTMNLTYLKFRILLNKKYWPLCSTSSWAASQLFSKTTMKHLLTTMT